MAHFVRHRPPQIADVQCTRLRFEPGDQVIVRVYAKLDRDQKRKLVNAIKKFARCEVEVFIVPMLEYDIEVVKRANIV